MSIDRSLRGANTLIRHRNVLSRVEKLQRLKDEEKWNDGQSIYKLPKVANRKLALGKGGKSKNAEAAAEAANAGKAAKAKK